MKGIELPTNTLVVFILALIVLIALISMFMSVESQSSSSISIETAKNSGCQRYVSLGYCKDSALNSGSTIGFNTVTCTDAAKTEAKELKTLAEKCYGLENTPATGAATSYAAYKLCCK